MKRAFLAGILILALLTGCGAPAAQDPTTIPETVPTQAAPAAGYYDPGNSLEQQTNGALRVYPLDAGNYAGAAVMGDGILLFAEQENGTQLILLTGETLAESARTTLDFFLVPDLPSTQISPDGISYFDPHRQETVLLDESLREITRISAPDSLTGEPLLSSDRQVLYYVTADALCALDLETRIPRVLRQQSAALTLEGLLLEDSLIHCSTTADEITIHSFFSSQTGQLMKEWEGTLSLSSQGSRYTGSLTQDGMEVVVFGTDTPRAFYPKDDCKLLPDSFAAVETLLDGTTTLNCYDLSTGTLRSSFTASEPIFPLISDGGDGILWLLAWSGKEECWVLYRWDTNALPSGDSACYTHTYYSRSNPDLAGIAQCQALAAEIGQKHGIEVLVWEDVLAYAPWDYRMTEEYLVPLLTQKLQLLDQQLSNFPEGFLATLTESFSGLTISLVRQLQGTTRALDTASGLQYWMEDHAYIALATTTATEGSLYHELCHVMDTRVYAHSNAYDQWEKLNPNGFEYDYDYVANASRNAGEYLRDAERCFIDTYSMSFPKEDRARILEYAMTPGNEHYFQSKTMQNKLYQICIGIREAFGLKKSGETFLWEQYLNQSLAYQK